MIDPELSNFLQAIEAGNIANPEELTSRARMVRERLLATDCVNKYHIIISYAQSVDDYSLVVCDNFDALVQELKELKGRSKIAMAGAPASVVIFYGRQLFLSKGPVQHLLAPDRDPIPLDDISTPEKDPEGRLL